MEERGQAEVLPVATTAPERQTADRGRTEETAAASDSEVRGFAGGTEVSSQDGTGRQSAVPAVLPVVLEIVRILGTSLLLAFFIVNFVGRAFTVEGPSMYPTLRSGERLIVDELSYRFGSPERGDVIVFRYPSNPKEFFVKRLVGLPGEVVAIHDGRVWVNGQPLPEDYLPVETLGEFGPAVVPEDHYFVLGDNRNNSADSRDPRVGFVPRKLVVGRAIWRYWPLERASVLRPPSEWQALAHP